MANLFFSEQTLSEIRERSSIVEVVSDYVTLKKTGRNHQGLCPFHAEKTPSFMVNEEKQIFHCFGCGAGGDVFTFLMKAGDFSFPQAVAEVAKRFGVALPAPSLSPGQKKEQAKKEILFQINETAAEYFHDLLTRRREGQEARTYLSKRGVSREIIQDHRLGCSLDRWDGLVQHLKDRKLPLETAREVGLVLPKKKEGWYDGFRGRVLFPIFDLHHRVVGFGGRLMKEGQPKYLNSPESAVYHKGELLYGLSLAKRSIQESDGAIIVEGYFDLLALHQYGWKNGVATLGTALTPHHVAALKRYTHHLITLFDGDSAGTRATLRSLPLFLEQDVWAKAAVLPPGEDPDSFLKKGKAEDFGRILAEAVPLIEYALNGLAKTHDARSVEGKVKIAQEGIGLLNRISDPIQKDLYLKALADRLDLPVSSLEKMARSSPREQPKAAADLRTRLTARDFPRSEELVVRLMIHAPNLIPMIKEEEILGDFEHPLLERMAGEIERSYRKEGKVPLQEVLERFEEGERQRLYPLAFQRSDLEGGDQEKILRDCLKKIRARKLMRAQADSLKRIRDSEKQGGEKGINDLLMKHQELTRQKRNL